MASNTNRKRSSKDLLNEWEVSKRWVDKYTRDFPEIDSLVDGVPI